MISSPPSSSSSSLLLLLLHLAVNKALRLYTLFKYSAWNNNPRPSSSSPPVVFCRNRCWYRVRGNAMRLPVLLLPPLLLLLLLLPYTLLCIDSGNFNPDSPLVSALIPHYLQKKTSGCAKENTKIIKMDFSRSCSLSGWSSLFWKWIKSLYFILLFVDLSFFFLQAILFIHALFLFLHIQLFPFVYYYYYSFIIMSSSRSCS